MADTASPSGELMTRTLAMPADSNASGDIFGGWVLSQMDIAAGIAAGQRAQGRVATVAIEAMSFLRPVHVGDVVVTHRDTAFELVATPTEGAPASMVCRCARPEGRPALGLHITLPRRNHYKSLTLTPPLQVLIPTWDGCNLFIAE